MDEWRVRLRAAIDRTNKKHSFIAEEAGIDPTTLSRILTGKMKRPSFVNIARIAHAAGTTVGEVLGERKVEFTAEEIAVLSRARDILMVRLAGG